MIFSVTIFIDHSKRTGYWMNVPIYIHVSTSVTSVWIYRLYNCFPYIHISRRRKNSSWYKVICQISSRNYITWIIPTLHYMVWPHIWKGRLLVPVLSIDNPRSKLLGSALDDDSANSLLCVRFPFNLHVVQYTLEVFVNSILSGSIYSILEQSD